MKSISSHSRRFDRENTVLTFSRPIFSYCCLSAVWFSERIKLSALPSKKPSPPRAFVCFQELNLIL